MQGVPAFIVLTSFPERQILESLAIVKKFLLEKYRGLEKSDIALEDSTDLLLSENSILPTEVVFGLEKMTSLSPTMLRPSLSRRFGSFLGGRVALRRAVGTACDNSQAGDEARSPLGPILSTETGAPLLPPHIRGF
jgi:hypothetical protein